MNAETVALIGITDGRLPVEDLLSDFNLYQYRTIVWLSSSLTTAMARFSGGRGIELRGIDKTYQRLTALHQWVSEGHDLVIVLDQLPKFEYQRGHFDEVFELASLPPFQAASFELATGNRVETFGQSWATNFFSEWLPALKFQVVISSVSAGPFLRVHRANPGPDQIVGAFQAYENGRIFFVPPIIGTAETLRSYYSALATLPDQLGNSRTALPEWTQKITLPAEALAIAKLTKLQEQAAAIGRLIADESCKLENASSLKQLIAGTGDDFLNAVAVALRELGLKVVDGPHPRADLLVADGTRLAAVEAKGREGCVREANVTQATRWAAEAVASLALPEDEREADADLKRYAEQIKLLGADFQSLECKPIAVVNTYRKQPLEERVEPDFPEPVLRVLSRSNVCALTGLQLLGVLLESRTDEQLKSKFIQKLFDTKGVLELIDDVKVKLLRG